MFGIPHPQISYRFQLRVDDYDIISRQTVRIELDIVKNTISTVLQHPVDPEGQLLIETLTELARKTSTVLIISLDGDGNQVGIISKQCKMIEHTMPMDYASSKVVEHTIKFKCL